MRKEASRLWEQALHDLNTAEKLLKIETYYASVFFSYQAAEKALKTLYLIKKRKRESTHDLIELAQTLKAPEGILEAAAELSPDYVITRYPNAANALPAQLYNQKSAKTHLEYSQKIIEWARKELKLT